MSIQKLAELTPSGLGCAEPVVRPAIANNPVDGLTLTFDQFIAKPPESKSVLVVAEMRSGYHAKPYIGEARTVAIAMLEAEIHHPTDDQGKQVRP